MTWGAYKAVSGRSILVKLFQRGGAFMLDALFWYTGLIAWALIVFGCISTLAIEAHDRSVMRREGHLN